MSTHLATVDSVDDCCNSLLHVREIHLHLNITYTYEHLDTINFYNLYKYFLN